MIEYKNQIDQLHHWIQSTNAQLRNGSPVVLQNIVVQQIRDQISELAIKIENEYPFYYKVLCSESNNLFHIRPVYPGCMELNTAVFGELYVIICHLYAEPINMQFWQNIRPRIVAVSKHIYADGHYASACDAAIKEIETRLRELFKEAKPGVPVPKEPVQLIGALLSDDCPYVFCDTSEVSGKNFRKGTKAIFDAVFTAYRNPSMHANIPNTQKEALEQIVQASQMMTILTQGEIVT